MNRSAISASLILLLACSYVSQAQDVETTRNVRCLIVGAQLSKSPDASQRSFGIMEVMYYFGRLDQAHHDLDLERLIAGEALTMNAAELATQATTCSSILAEKGRSLERIAGSLVLRDQQQKQQQSSRSK
jgi:hypothetical protein